MIRVPYAAAVLLAPAAPQPVQVADFPNIGDFAQEELRGGVNLNLVALNLAFEAEKMGDNVSLSAKSAGVSRKSKEE